MSSPPSGSPSDSPAGRALPHARSPATPSARWVPEASQPCPAWCWSTTSTDSLGITALAAGILVDTRQGWDVVIDPVIGSAERPRARAAGARGARS